jgi:hypothetical protein
MFKKLDACLLLPPDKRGLTSSQGMVCGLFDGREGGRCTTVATMDGSLYIAKQGRIWVETSGLGNVVSR